MKASSDLSFPPVNLTRIIRASASDQSWGLLMLLSIASDTICKAGGQSLQNQSLGLSTAELIKVGQVELLVEC